MEHEQEDYALELLNATHEFPCPYQIKVIGRADNAFESRIVAAVRIAQQLEYDPPHRTRHTPNGRHLSVTVEPNVESAEEVLHIYRCIRRVEGIVMIM